MKKKILTPKYMDQKKSSGWGGGILVIIIILLALAWVKWQEHKCDQAGGVFVTKVGCMRSNLFQ